MFRKLKFGLNLISFSALLILGVALYLILRGNWKIALILMIISAIEAYIYMGGWRDD